MSVGHEHRGADVYINIADTWVLSAVQESWTKPQWMAKSSKCRYSPGAILPELLPARREHWSHLLPVSVCSLATSMVDGSTAR